jgi:glyoxylase-like metal-dependent hydrolase (beta-lactamase superfamily II)
MTSLTRRGVLGGAAALAMAGAARPALAQSRSGFYRFKVGDIEVTSISDGVRSGKLTASPSKSASFEQFQEALAADGLPRDEIATSFNTLAVKNGKSLFVIDTGNGLNTAASGTGQAAANFRAAGYDPKDVEAVIISHFHGDHIGGLITPERAQAFPNAEVRVPLVEFNYWMDDANMNAAPEGSGLRNGHMNVRRVFGAIPGKFVSKFEWGKEVAPGITAIGTPGHTPGHTAFRVASGNASLIAQADVVSGIGSVFVRHPDWFAGGDMDGPTAVATRRKLYDMLVADKLLTTGYHLPVPGVGNVEKSGDGYKFVPVA